MLNEAPNGTAQPAQAFDWPLANEAENVLRKAATEFLERNSFAKVLSERMRQETATDFFEWIDHVGLGAESEESLRATGFQPETGCATANGETTHEYR